MSPAKLLSWTLFLVSYVFILSVAALAQTKPLDVSYDVARKLDKDSDPVFAASWQKGGGQQIIARHHDRPDDESVLAANTLRLPKVATFGVDTLHGGWAKALKEHFSDSGIYDQIVVKR